MSKIKLFIATSLDGFIARENGALDWLPGSNPNEEINQEEVSDAGYSEFIESVDSIIMGRKTYEMILGFGIDWPYPNHKNYVFTSDLSFKASTENTTVVNLLSPSTVQDIRSKSEKDIWLMGGGSLITEFINQDLLEEMTLTIVPTLIGNGIKLFPDNPKETKFQLIKSESFPNGMNNLTYQTKK